MRLKKNRLPKNFTKKQYHNKYCVTFAEITFAPLKTKNCLTLKSYADIKTLFVSLPFSLLNTAH